MSVDRRQAWGQGVMTGLLIVLIFAQKIGFSVAGGVLELGVPAVLGAGVLLVVTGAAAFDGLRLCLYALFCLTVFVSQLLVGRPVSATAVLLVLALYLPAVLRIELDEARWRAVIGAFVAAMGVIAAVVVCQFVAQRIWGAGAWPNLDRILPQKILTPGYNYYRETRWNSGVYQPNGVFMLEPAVVSQFLAVAVAAELAVLRNMPRLLLLLAGLVTTMAGTGLVVLAVGAPFLVLRMRPRTLAAVAAAGAAALAVGASVGWMSQVAGRAGEVFTPGTSGYIRYTQPLMGVAEKAARPLSAITGDGAGSTPVDPNNNSLPFSKLIGEYGFAATAAFYALFFFALFAGAPRARIAVVLAAMHLLGGGSLSVSAYAGLILILGMWPRLAPPDQTGGAASA
jgi:hypothetical protein